MAAPQHPAARSATPTLDYGQSTDQGSRKRNEDAALVYPTDEGVIVMVADGMGSGLDGQLFSKRAVERAQASMLAAVDLPAQARVEQAMRDAAEALHRMRMSDARYGQSGSTLVIGLISRQASGAQAVVSYVGDSRAYIIRANGQTEAITTDHSYTQQLIRDGVDSATANADPQGALLTHVLGQNLAPTLISESTSIHRLHPDDSLILCSDGISKVIAQADLARFVRGRSAQEAADAVVRLAVRDKSVRGRDNATAVVVCCRSGVAQRDRPQRRGGIGVIVVVGLILVALAAAGLMLSAAMREPPPTSPTRPVSENTVELPPTATATIAPTDGRPPQLPPTSTGAPSITATATATVTPSPTATNTRVPVTRVPLTATPSSALPEGSPTSTALSVEIGSPTSTNTPEPAPTSTNTPEPAPTSTNTPEPAPTSTNTPELTSGG